MTTGLVYGPYHYTSTLGPWLGSVPVLIPLAWFVLIYTSYLVANLITERLPVRIPGGRGDVIGLALCGALVMTASDLIVDPILSGPGFRAWVWERRWSLLRGAGPELFRLDRDRLHHSSRVPLDRATDDAPARRTALDDAHGASPRASPVSCGAWVDLRLGSASRARRDF